MRSLLMVIGTVLLAWSNPANALDGSWARPWIGDAPGYFYKFIYKFAPQTFDITSATVVSRPARGFYVFDAVTTVEYRLGQLLRMEGQIKVYQFDTRAVRRSMIPRTHATAGLFWQMRECGVTSWQVDTAVDMTTKTCTNFKVVSSDSLPIGATDYSIIGISDDAIYMADTSADPAKDGTSPSRRPEKLVLDMPMKKQLP